MVVGHRRQGVYGQRFVEGGSPERKAAFHGRWEEEAGLVAMGPRHVNRVDGRWLQPEPLLMEGIPQAQLKDPRSVATYRYSRNTPGTYQDPTGRTPAALVVAWGVFEVVGTAADLLAVGASAYGWTQGTVTTTALVVDVGLTAVGLVSPAAGMAGGAKGMKGVVSMADEAIDAARAAGAADEAAAVASSGLDDLATFRSELGLKPGEGTLSRLDVGGESFYGINAHGQPVTMKVNAITKTHAEADSFQQAINAGATGKSGTLYVDRDLCAACGVNGGVKGMAPQAGIEELEVVTPSGSQVITP
jgi:RHS repeat-associated protein